MKEDAEKKLIEIAPYIFRYEGWNNIRQSLMSFGLSCGDGWYSLLKDLITGLAKIDKEQRIRCVQVKEKFGCYDIDTEVLTEAGWKFFKSVTYKDRIMTLSKDGIIEYQNPTDIISYKYSGEMYKLQSRGVDLLVTPNHNLYVAKPSYVNGKKGNLKRNYDFELMTYEKYFKKNKRFLKTGTWVGEYKDSIKIEGYSYTNKFRHRTKKEVTRSYLIKDKEYSLNQFLDFLGWFIAEGCANEKTGDISIAYCNTDGGEEKNIIETVLKKLNFKIRLSMEDRSAGIFKIYDKALSRWLVLNCGKHAYNKKIPSFVKNLPPQQIKILLTSLYAGDGHKSKTAHTLYTVSNKLSDDVQELLLKCGDCFSHTVVKNKSSNTIRGSHDCNCINWLKLKDFNSKPKNIIGKNYIECMVSYNNMVYCVEVPNHILYIRRNGKGCWCGNSLRFYYDIQPPTNEKTIKRENLIEKLINRPLYKIWSFFYFTVLRHKIRLPNPYVFGLRGDVDRLIRIAEAASYKTCEVCGNPGKPNDKGWISTLCNECREKRNKRE